MEQNRVTARSAVWLVSILAYAQPFPSSQTVTFGMIGMAARQTARVNVLNPAVVPLTAPAVCTAQITFWDAQGNNLKTATAPVAAQQAISLDLGGSDVSVATTRLQIRATVTSTAAGVAPDAPVSASSCNLIPTLEVFDDDSGKTSLILTQTATVVTLLPSSGLFGSPLTR